MSELLVALLVAVEQALVAEQASPELTKRVVYRLRIGTAMPPTITCPKCSRTSCHPKDIEEGYCGACHAWTSRPAVLRNGRVLHIAEDDTPTRSGYKYSATGVGIRQDLIDAILQTWGAVSPTGDPALTLKSVNNGAINEVGSLARITAQGVVEFLVALGEMREANDG